MRGLEHSLLRTDAILADALGAIERGSAKIALVVDGEQRLSGTITDGDVRRGLLRGLNLQDPVSSVMNTSPVTAPVGLDRQRLLALMQQEKLLHLPLVDAAGRVVGIETLSEVLAPVRRDNPVVLMAGGKGTRLGALTRERPKPLLHVGPKPVLETLLEGLAAAGLWRFYISVNYRAAMVEEHFGDGSQWGVTIHYLRESEPLGTAGALSLLPRDEHTALVMNGDLVTRVNFASLLDFHAQQGADATMCVRSYDHRIPYGVVLLDGQRIARIEEKPTNSVLVNAGIYLLEPGVLDLVAPATPLDMTALFDRARGRGLQTVAFPVGEYWIDIGRVEDLTQALLDVEGGLLDRSTHD